MKHFAVQYRNQCPSCGCDQSELFLEVPDHRVSNALFSLRRCIECNLVYTWNVPFENEIGAFYKAESYDSHRLDNQSLVSRIYRLVRSISVKRKVKWVSRYLKKGVVVDYGCGLGHFVGALKDKGFDAQGFEIDSDVRALAKSELNLELKPLEDFNFLSANSVDLISMWHVLEHIYHLNDDFENLNGRLKSKGILMVAVPNYKSFDAQVYGADWEAYDVPRHLYHFDSQTIVGYVEPKGFDLLEVIPLKFDSYYVSMRSEVNRSSGSVLRGVFNGLRSNWLAKKYGYSSHVFVFRKL